MGIYWIDNAVFFFFALKYLVLQQICPCEASVTNCSLLDGLRWSCWDTPGAFWSSRLLSAARDSAITSTCDSHQKPREQPFSNWISLRAEAEAGVGVRALHKGDLEDGANITLWLQSGEQLHTFEKLLFLLCKLLWHEPVQTYIYKEQNLDPRRTVANAEQMGARSLSLSACLSHSLSLSRAHTHLSICFYLSFMWSINTCWYKATAFCSSRGELLRVTQSRTE